MEKLPYLELGLAHVPILIAVCTYMHWGILFRDGESFFCSLGTVSPVSLGRNASKIMPCSHLVLSGFVCPMRHSHGKETYDPFDVSLPSFFSRYCTGACTRNSKIFH